MSRAPTKLTREYMGTTITFHPTGHVSRFSGLTWRWSAGLSMYADTLAGIKMLIREKSRG